MPALAVVRNDVEFTLSGTGPCIRARMEVCEVLRRVRAAAMGQRPEGVVLVVRTVISARLVVVRVEIGHGCCEWLGMELGMKECRGAMQLFDAEGGRGWR